MQTLNEKLRQINAELRRQREAQESILSAVGLGAAEPAGPAATAGGASCSGPGPGHAAAAAPTDSPDAGTGGEGEVANEGEGGISGVQAAAALEALRRQAELLQRERAALEAALASPSAAHPEEAYGEQRLSIARARRQIAQCIRWVAMWAGRVAVLQAGTRFGGACSSAAAGGCAHAPAWQARPASRQGGAWLQSICLPACPLARHDFARCSWADSHALPAPFPPRLLPACRSGSKELVRDGRQGEVFPLLEQASCRWPALGSCAATRPGSLATGRPGDAPAAQR